MQIKNLLKYLIVFAAFVLITLQVKSQDSTEASENIAYSLPVMRILDLEGPPPSLTFIVPTNGGALIADVSSNTSWLNYTSITENGNTNKITVSISGDNVPAGTKFKVQASEYTGNGDGEMGTPTGLVVLSASSQDLITGIGSCYTGTGTANGHQLTYTWTIEPDGYSSLAAVGSSTITATYTIIAGL